MQSCLVVGSSRCHASGLEHADGIRCLEIIEKCLCCVRIFAVGADGADKDKVLALPEFIAVIALARLLGGIARKRGWPALRIMLAIEFVLLAAFFALAVRFGPFEDADRPLALLTGFAGIAAMAIQNALQRVHLSSLPPTTLMTGSTTQATIDAVDLLAGTAAGDAAAVRTRFSRLAMSVLVFAAGCASGALLYWLTGFWCLAIPVLIGAVAAFMRLDETAQ